MRARKLSYIEINKAFTRAGFINKGLKDFERYKAVEMVWPQEQNH